MIPQVFKRKNASPLCAKKIYEIYGVSRSFNQKTYEMINFSLIYVYPRMGLLNLAYFGLPPGNYTN